ncbi:MAG: hypothetical protein RR307_06275 [Clostridia bacterium]
MKKPNNERGKEKSPLKEEVVACANTLQDDTKLESDFADCKSKAIKAVKAKDKESEVANNAIKKQQVEIVEGSCNEKLNNVNSDNDVLNELANVKDNLDNHLESPVNETNLPKQKNVKGEMLMPNGQRLKKAISWEGLICIAVIVLMFVGLSLVMGFSNAINTLFANAFDLLINTVFYILALAVVAGALSAVLTEFGVISLANKALSPLMKPLFGMPGATIIGVFTCYMSDNPAILTLADDKKFRCFFKKYQLPALCNVGTAFGMGLIVTVFMLGLSTPENNFGLAVLVGNLCAVVGGIVSCRLMLIKTKKLYGKETESVEGVTNEYNPLNYREIRKGKWTARLFDALLEGGASGVKVGVSVIPGVLIICNFVMLLTCGVNPETGGYTGGAFEGVNLINYLGKYINVILEPLFGFSNPANVAVPLTALGSAAAATSLVKTLVNSGSAIAGDIAVFTSMCMCWSGYLSTHVAMMDSLKFRNLTGWAIFSHTIGGLVAGVAANYLFKLVALLL